MLSNLLLFPHSAKLPMQTKLHLSSSTILLSVLLLQLREQSLHRFLRLSQCILPQKRGGQYETFQMEKICLEGINRLLPRARRLEPKPKVSI